ncbi:hypothetical protein [Natronolimnobius baerhuensis]|uniref:Uncharacterized protein n=1 Tax=Natronolimnobius baerhuensis TaxID=253108 RepID=A0A202E6B5_9EURY|nr:hypothetical protein [Natronolimnobius baerhuensis]OVE83708.1 hypothetical protein B2G88_14875 [Natronolimnobius baerhuensis]
MSRPPRDADELLVCADVLGAFGVTAADITRGHRRASGSDDSLEAALADRLADGRDRTTVLRRTIAQSDRGVSCPARYTEGELEAELTAVFDAIDWTLECERWGRSGTQRWTLRTTDHRGRERETELEYPTTPLGSDNLPAVLRAINEALLSGTYARFVLLSAGVDRWQAALVDERDDERLCDQYGPRITAVERPLLPADGLEAYVPDEGGVISFGEDGPWPAWAHERESTSTPQATAPTESDLDATDATAVDSLIEEAEHGGSADDVSSDTDSSAEQRDSTAATPDTTAPTAERGGFELCGSPTVSRVSDEGGETGAGTDADEYGAQATSESRSNDSSAEPPTEPDDNDGFGSLSGSSTTARVSNDSFGSDVEWESDTDRYRALGVALGAGGRVSVRGLLEDEDFLPELPAMEPEETRLRYEDPFDPGALREAKAAAEQSGFVWVDSGTLETTRVSNG